ncbi:unnamed protein product, partial [Amoebophrya sp. A120]|eukprot:GSA120T00015448001.1
MASGPLCRFVRRVWRAEIGRSAVPAAASTRRRIEIGLANFEPCGRHPVAPHAENTRRPSEVKEKAKKQGRGALWRGFACDEVNAFAVLRWQMQST